MGGLLNTLLCGSSDRCLTPWLGLVPIAGPLLLSAYGHVPLGIGILASAIQVAGASTAIAGIIFRKPVWVLNRKHAPPVAVTLTGAGIQGQF